jgi:hypothetical protein
MKAHDRNPVHHRREGPPAPLNRSIKPSRLYCEITIVEELARVGEDGM